MTIKDTCSILPIVSNFHGNGTFGPTSPANRYQQTNSPGPDPIYGSAETTTYVQQATSPQPSGFQTLTMSRGPLIPAAFTNGYH